MRQIFEVTMDAKDKYNPIDRIFLRIVGLSREAAMNLAEQTYPTYSIAYVLGGYRQDDKP